LRQLPGTPGVYRFRACDGGALYIGRATALRSRVGSYWSAWLERNLLEAHKPSWNRTVGGQEVQVYIGMRPDRGLSVTHLRDESAQTRWFGPYLGGLRHQSAANEQTKRPERLPETELAEFARHNAELAAAMLRRKPVSS
jgi:excinuclease ABC subunit C